ncbi:cyst nematode resistance protein-like protein [Oryza sativa Japonica Group]|uniref:Cyst nematode resistance protein-like protein n=2 Tax=Oryza sativa subsp. japonica TaxID=39947 RepID=Q5N8P2_ORYSJ|nr:cyst nematode resistance protein-like protein [Oryza sativa Japonica Group]BAD82516.1 cyst nematode resistance protein-like protein [Oryza sativa Japonica Group]
MALIRTLKRTIQFLIKELLKECFFIWLAVKGRCLTGDNLAKRGWPHDPLCALCSIDMEDCHHLLVKCPYTNRVWSLLRDRINVHFDIPGRLDLSLADWWQLARTRFQTRYSKAFDTFFMLVCWLVWKERNARVFDQKFNTADLLSADIKEEVAVWRAAGIFQFCE